MKWLEEHQIEAIVESMREAHFEGRAGAVSVEIGPEGIRAIADGREIRPAEEPLILAGVARPSSVCAMRCGRACRRAIAAARCAACTTGTARAPRGAPRSSGPASSCGLDSLSAVPLEATLLTLF